MVAERYEIKINVFGDKIAARGILRIAERADNMRPLFEHLADDFLEIERKQFDSEGFYGSGGWKPLKPATVAEKLRAGQDPRILHATHALRQSLTVRGAAGSSRRIRRTSMFLGTTVRSAKGFPYAKAHQNPIKHPDRRREPVAFRREDRKRWVQEIQRYLAGKSTFV